MESNQSVALIGFGKSNQAVYDYLKSKGIDPVIRVPSDTNLPSDAKAIIGKDYLHTSEDVIFRSPVVRPDKIKAKGKIYTEIGYFLEKTPAYKIGITGSDGKTTTSTIIYEILKGENQAYLGGNIGTPLINYLDKMQKDHLCVCELSSFQLFDTRPPLDTAIITGITQNHLDWHKDMREYVSAKENILVNSKRLVLSLDMYENRRFTNKEIIYFSSHKPRCFKPNSSYVYVENGKIVFNGNPLLEVSEIKLRGKFNLLNYLCAIATTYPLVPLDKIREVARTFSGVAHRMEVVDKIKDVTFIDSSIDSTPSRTNATLSALDLESTVVILGGYDKNLDYTILEKTLSQAKGIVLCGENSEKIYNSIKCKSPIFTTTLEEATNVAHSLAKPRGTVILSPASASFDMFENYYEKSKAYRKAINSLK